MTNKKKISDIKNREYQQNIDKYNFYADLHNGGDCIEKKAKYLPRHPFETDSQYQIRLNRTVYRNYAAPIVDAFVSAVWRKRPVRNLPADYDEYIADTDMSGSDANQFFRNVCMSAAIRGVCFVLCDTPADTGMTIAEAKQKNIRPYFVKILPEHVTDYEVYNGRLKWIKIVESFYDYRESPYQEQKEVIQYRVFTENEWYLIGTNDRNEEYTLDSGSHSCGQVPLIPFYFEKSGVMTGISAIAEIARLCLRIYWRDSELDKAVFDLCVPILFGRNIQEKERAGFVRSSSNGLFINNFDADLKYIEPSGKTFETNITLINQDISAIREIALRSLKTDTRLVESAESKRIDRDYLIDKFKKFSTTSQHSEFKCWQICSAWLNKDLPADTEIYYNDDFDTDQIQTDILQAFKDLANDGMVSKYTVRKMIERGEVLPGYNPDDDEKQIQREAAENNNTVRSGGLNNNEV